MATKNNDAETKALFDAALARVESASIRAWAISAHNRPLWLQITADYVAKGRKASNADDVLRLSTYITIVAIGA